MSELQYMLCDRGNSLCHYHSDHLGSSSWISDQEGTPVQHLQYLPFGESWVDQQNSSWNAQYTFSGKEKDWETGYSYFGARYYDSQLSIWLSVDPRASSYPSLTPYNYCTNNPINYTDPNGEWVHLVIGAVFGGIMNWTANGAEFSWQGLGYFGIGAVAGALSAGIGAGVNVAMAGGSFAAGFAGTAAAGVAGSSFLNGAAIGLGSGFSSGFTTGFGNSLMQGNKFGNSLVNGLVSGGIAGGSAALMGGLIGGIEAKLDDRRFVDGARVIETILLEQNIPDVTQTPEGCLAANMKAIEESFGGSLSMDEINRLVEWGTGGAYDIPSWKNYANATGRILNYELSADDVISQMTKGARVSVNLNLGEDVGHSVVLRSIHSRQIFKLSGKYTSSIYYKVMNPGGSGWNIINMGNLRSAWNIFFLY